MNIFAALFGIFRQKGLVATLREGKPLRPLFLVGLPFIVLAGALYGLAMGIGIDVDTAVKDAVKIALVYLLTFLLSYPIFLLSYRLLGREEKAGQVGTVPLTLLASTATLMMVTSPMVFMLSLLVGYTAESIYIHVAILNLGLLLGLYLAGSVVYFAFTSERTRLLVPNIISVVLLGVIAGVLIAFFNPLLAPSRTFSVGTDRLRDRLGMGVAPKAEAAFTAAREANLLQYQYVEMDARGIAERDYTVIRSGENYHLAITLHTVGEDILKNKEVWVLEGRYYCNFDGPVQEVSREDLVAILDPALPQAALTSPTEVETMRFRARLSDYYYTITGEAADGQETTVVTEASTGQLRSFRWVRPETMQPAITEVNEIAGATLDEADFRDSLNKAILRDGVAFGVAPTVRASFTSARETERLQYQYIEQDAHGNTERDYTVTRSGENYHLAITLHAVPGEAILRDKEIWILEGRYYCNFTGTVQEVSRQELAGFLDPALPQAALTSPTEVETMTFWAQFSGGRSTITGQAPDGQEATIVTEVDTGWLLSFRWVRPETLGQPITEVNEIAAAIMDTADFQDGLNRATVLGAIDRSDATMQDYVNDEEFFAVRYPRTWRIRGTWNPSDREIAFSSCTGTDPCPGLTVTVLDLVPDWDVENYAAELAQSLERDPVYRSATYTTTAIGEISVGLVTYLSDTTVEGEIQTTEVVVYIFVGKENRFHLRFSALEGELEDYRALFETMATRFTFLQ